MARISPKKDNKKKELEEAKQKRAKERQIKKQERELLKKSKIEKKTSAPKQKKRKKSSSSDSEPSEEWVESGDSLDEITDISNIDDVTITDKTNLNENLAHKEGDYVVVEFPGKKKVHVCVIQEILSKSEAEVVAMVRCNESKTTFKLDPNDVSVISFDQIKETLPFPNMISAGDRLKYDFGKFINVDQ